MMFDFFRNRKIEFEKELINVKGNMSFKIISDECILVNILKILDELNLDLIDFRSDQFYFSIVVKCRKSDILLIRLSMVKLFGKYLTNIR